MYRPIHSPDQPVTLVGGGEASPALLKTALAHAPRLVAADGGAGHALEAGVLPEAVVGDFDSLGGLDLPGAIKHHMPDQNQTDFQKCLSVVDAPMVLGVGFLGGRLDHQLAAMTTLLQEPRPVVLLKADEIAFLSPLKLTLDLPEGMAIGLYPLLSARLTSRGLRYPLSDAEVAPDGLISTSNHVEGGPIEISLDRRALLVTLPLEALETVLDALAR
ncbi:MAG: thiamine diphosphokinase [Rhodobacteraceae bacterium]|nr:thiamine diphosphokinase [Paracoccaceae bacterium]